MADEQLAILVPLRDFASQELRKLDQNVARTGGTVSKLRESFLSARNVLAGFAGAFAVRQIAGFITSTTEAADKVLELSRQTGLSTEALSELRYASQLTGVEFEGLTTGLVRGIKGLEEFSRTGAGPAREALDVLGQGIKESVRQGKSLEDLLPELSEAFKQLSAEQRVFAATELFGRGGAPIIQLLTSDIEALRQEARDLGLSLSQEAAEGADEFNDSIIRLKGAFTGLRQEIVLTLGPALTEVFNNAADSFAILRREGVLEFLARAGAELGAAFGGERRFTEREVAEERSRGLKQQAEAAKTAAQEMENLRRVEAERDRETFRPRIGVSSPEALEAEFPEVGPTLEQRGLGEEEIAAFKSANEAYKTRIEVLRQEADLRDQGLARQRETIQAWQAEHDALVGLRGAFADLQEESKQYGIIAREIAFATRDLLADNISQALENIVSNTKSLKEAFKDMARGILQDLQRLIIRTLVYRAVSGIVGGLGGALTGGGAGGGLVGIFGSQPAITPLGQAHGGVAPGHLLSLRGHYQFGGVARSRGLYELAEGLPEAIVPLPDRRSIPVRFQGAGGTQIQQTIIVNYTQSGPAGSGRGDRAEERAVLRRNAETIAEIIAEKQNSSLAFREALR